MKNPARILLAEDDSSFGYILKEYLDFHGYDTVWLKDGATAIKRIQKDDFDLCILDIMMPGADGFEVARVIKTNSNYTPFIFLTARSLKTDKLKGFREGCDDYEVKPVDEELLLAKIEAILKRSKKHITRLPAQDIVTIGKYSFNAANQSLLFENHTRTLTEKETALLRLLYAHKNQLVERKYILKEVWGVADLFSRKSMDVFITRLRKYLSGDTSIKITNIHNRGFIFHVPEDP